MPLLRLDILEGRSPDQLKALLNATHSALAAAFRIPERDRCQIVHEHPVSRSATMRTGSSTACAGRARLDYRPVHLQPLSNEVQAIPPKERVY
ncbi:tautomerase family protein [Bradyrhizobium australiense]|uniref:tautomerase family protein n=1 Tax=Bradyrhizobium australiense TaxID=2721161 RepID=UPI001F46C492|nr:tautomerase family protein [Bradyrhizobium australiense]